MIALLATLALALAPSPLVVSPLGTVGPLRLDASTEAAVRAYAGRPTHVYVENTHLGYPSYRDLQYRRGATWVEYAINQRTHRLAGFWTSSPLYRSPRGVRVGMRLRVAIRRERARYTRFGCLAGFASLARGPARLYFNVNARDRIESIVLESRRHPLGLLVC